MPTHHVLFISIDDLGNVLGKTRPSGLQTPHLDRLAARGVFFERAYCQIPLCNPARASVMTGLRPDQLGVYDLDRHFRVEQPTVVTLPQLFRQQGGGARRVGKIYHYDVPKGIGTDGLDDAPSWDRVINPSGRDVAEEALIINPTPEKPVSAALSWLAAGGADEEQTDGKIALEGARMLQQAALGGTPQFVGVGFFRPHTPFVAPKRYFDLYPPHAIRLPEIEPGDRESKPLAAFPHNCFTPGYGLSEEDLKESLRAYYANVSFVDAQVGVLLDALDRDNLWDQTLVVLWSDHGYHLGEHGLWQKRSLYDESARAPLIIAGPQIPEAQRGRVCRAAVEMVDVYPSICDLVGLKPPPGLAGVSLRPLLENPDAEWVRPAFTQILRLVRDEQTLSTDLEQLPMAMGRAVTMGRWRYIEWEDGRSGRELYDHQSDPWEKVNLAERPEHQELMEDLRELFSDLVRADSPEAVVKRRL